MESKFLESFKRLSEKGQEYYKLKGANILIEKLDEQEITTKSGLIIQTSKDQANGMNTTAADLAVVLMVGEGYWDNEEEKIVPTELRPGNVILAPRFSVAYYSTFPGLGEPSNNKLGIVGEEQIILFYKDIAAYKAAAALLRGE